MKVLTGRDYTHTHTHTLSSLSQTESFIHPPTPYLLHVTLPHRYVRDGGGGEKRADEREEGKGKGRGGEGKGKKMVCCNSPEYITFG